MAIIINDFEVAVEPPATEAENPENTVNTTEQGQGAAQKTLTPQDVECLIERKIDRELRLLAH